MPNLEKGQPVEPNSNHNPFAECVPVLGELDVKTAQVLEGLHELGIQFAEIMQERQMPIDEAIVGEDVTTKQDGMSILTGRRLPVWMVLDETNLTGESMFYGRVGRETHSVSLLSHTPNNFQTHYTRYEKESKFNKALEEKGYGDKAYYTKRAVGLTANGKYVGLFRHGRMGYQNPYISTTGLLTVSDKALKPSDLFAPETAMSPDEIKSEMEQRMKTKIGHYYDKLAKELAQLGEGEVIVRPADYYQPKEKEIYRHEAPKGSKKRWGFFSI